MMDGPLAATIVTSSVIIGGAIGGGFWKLWVKVGDQSKCIGRMEGKMDGLDTRMHGQEKQLDGVDTRIDRLDRRLNGLVDTLVGKGDKK